MRDRSRFVVIIILLAGIFIGFYLGFLVDNHLFDLRSISDPLNIEIRQGQGSLINPLLECNTPKQIGAQEYGKLEENFNNYVNKQIANNKAENISIYFRTLNNGPWIGIHEQDNFKPASLLKVPLMMTYYKLSESNPKILEENITFTASDEKEMKKIAQFIVPEKTLELNQTYTIDQLIARMITYSDNNSWNLLIKKIGFNLFFKIFDDIGFSVRDRDLGADSLSVKEYASFFRILYNASYLSHTNSEKALKLLMGVSYKDGLVAKLPNSIRVAHKFGERELPDGVKQLHDCGIVYYPKYPYLICVMTTGGITSDLQRVIQDVSELTYKEVDLKYRGK